MTKLLHWCAWRMSDFAIWLHDRAGALECWCDTRAERRRWLAWSKKHGVPVTWLPMPELDLSDFKMPHPDETLTPVKPRPLTMLDEWERDTDPHQ